MPHHHFAARHAHGHAHAHVQRQEQDLWDKITSKVAGAINNAFPTPANKQVEPSTSYRTVYITQTPSSFQGRLTTLRPSATSAVAVPAKVTVNADKSELETASSATPKPTTLLSKAVTKSAPQTPKELSEITTVSPDTIPSTLAMAPTTTPTTTTRRFPTAAAATPTPTPSAEVKSEGTSGATKAGIAIGILAGVLVLFLAVYFLFTRRRKQVEEQQRQAAEDDEKRNGPFSDRHAIAATTPTSTTPAKAPQLSLRPGSQFSPNLNPHPDRRASRGANMAMRDVGASGLQQMSTVNHNNSAANPFGDHAQRMHTPIAEESPRPVSPASIQHSEVGTAITTNSPPRTSPVGTAAAAGVAVGVARKTSIQRGNTPKALDMSRGASNEGEQVTNGNLARKASLRKENAAPSPLDLTMPQPLGTIPASPAGTEFSFNSVAPGQTPGPSDSAAAIAAAGGPPQSTVHRVQLDFKPTMEDELELRAGQLVRLLHEYDDGWVSLKISQVRPSLSISSNI